MANNWLANALKIEVAKCNIPLLEVVSSLAFVFVFLNLTLVGAIFLNPVQ